MRIITLLALPLATLFLTGCGSLGRNPATGVPDRAYRGVVYREVGAQDAGGGVKPRKLALDIYVPQRKDPQTGRAVALAEPPPLVIWYHGGGWKYGHRRLYFLTRKLTRHGFAVATVSYRLSGGAQWPAQAEDVFASLDYLRAHSAEYGYDAERVGVAGNSAGGHLAAYVGVMRGRPEVDAVLALYPPTDLVVLGEPHVAKGDPNLISDLLGGPMGEVQKEAYAASPVNFVDAGDPPFLFIHGDQDPTVPLAQSRFLEERLLAAGVEARTIVEPGRGHGFSLDKEQLATVAEFFRQELGDDGAGAETRKKP